MGTFTSFNENDYLAKRFVEIYLAALNEPKKAQGASFRVSEAQLYRLLELWKYNAFPYREQPLPDAMGRRAPAYYDDTWHLNILASLEAAQAQVFSIEVDKNRAIERLQCVMREFSNTRGILDEVAFEESKAFLEAFLVKLTGT